MKTLVKRAAILIAAALVLTAFSGGALAAGSSVTYEGNADQFVFLPSADLFQNFKGVMPGDTLTQQITVKNNTPSGYKVKIYLRAEAVEENYRSFLSQMTLKVVQDGGSTLFQAAADQQDGLASNVCLGTFSSGADVQLDVSLAVPLEMGNEFQRQTGLIRWVFTAEEIPDNPDNPDTNDTARLWLYMGISGVGLGGLLTIFMLRQRRAHKKDSQADM